jgi:hypothetical protein
MPRSHGEERALSTEQVALTLRCARRGSLCDDPLPRASAGKMGVAALGLAVLALYAAAAAVAGSLATIAQRTTSQGLGQCTTA